MEYKRQQKESKRKSKIGRVFRPNETYMIKKQGLWGHENEVFKSMFEKDGKTVIRFKKLSSIQKKVCRKLRIDKRVFIELV